MTAGRRRPARFAAAALPDPMVPPAPTRFAAIGDAAALPYAGEGGRQGYLKHLQMPAPKAFAIAADGAWSASALGNDPLAAALESCRKAHRGCRLYAVDRDVVWQADGH